MWHGKVDDLRWGIWSKKAPEEDAKSPSPSPNKLQLMKSPREIPRKLEHREVRLTIWESKSRACKHNYRDEVFHHLLEEEMKQVTAWDIIRKGAVTLDTFAVKRQICIEYMINFSVEYKLLPKTTEASFMLLYRFLLLPEAKSILESSSGVNDATGKFSLSAVAICFLMISAKYEETYPPNLSTFASHAYCSTWELLRLEIKLLQALNWNLVTSTSVDFLGRFLEALKPDIKTRILAMFILESS